MSNLKANALVIKSAAKGPRATCTIEGHPGLDLQACQSARNFAPSIALIFRRPGSELRSGAEQRRARPAGVVCVGQLRCLKHQSTFAPSSLPDRSTAINVALACPPTRARARRAFHRQREIVLCRRVARSAGVHDPQGRACRQYAMSPCPSRREDEYRCGC
jgi:hypothetical protein